MLLDKTLPSKRAYVRFKVRDLTSRVPQCKLQQLNLLDKHANLAFCFQQINFPKKKKNEYVVCQVVRPGLVTAFSQAVSQNNNGLC